MLSLPILNVRLSTCHEDWQQMTPTAQGRHCQSCQRTVVDFTHATQADLDAARAASPDGRLCGRFRREQLAPVQPLVQLRPKLRRFLVALVLVCGLGLTSGEAWAQVRKAELNTRFEPTTQLQLKTPEELSPLAPTTAEAPERMLLGEYVEVMPTFKGGMKGLQAYMRQNLHYPDSTTASGKVFVSFLVTKTGAIADAKVLKGIGPLLDAEALRVVRQMPAWEPARQNEKAVDMRYTLPITFSREPADAAHTPKGRRRAAGR
ncbi:energy transducer TonB [Hymenobacter chitinivorans]|uniref:Protein TonB n=1 Tax=Hymenobacter chitinivorans DSM 11115 TaxID=1121954 RepID=A0A2M9B522_9BACT|nr:energy transducer TonB [Hymenobacter chitinivorans]PJJ53051.1 protein TonB [Hymenobacter chitinivorans DSM 11115]